MIGTTAFTKEARALFPTFLVGVLMVAQAAVAERVFHVSVLLLAACLAPIVLGSMSVGHEYSHRTLTLLFSQPIGRGRLFAIKAAVLVPMVALLALAVFLVLPGPVNRFDDRALLVLAPLYGLCVAPAMSMLARSPLAAIVFTIAIPGVLLLFAQVAGTAIYGFANPRAVTAFAVAVSWRLVALLCLAGAVATWRMFHRLQALEGQSEVQMPAWLRPAAGARAAPRVRRSWSSLVRKELRLQPLAYVVACLYVPAAAAMWALQVYAPEFPRVPIEAMSILYSGLVSILIGAIASAEERQLGTLPAQLLQPMAAWLQWSIKAGTALGLALLLGLVLPLLVNGLLGTQDFHEPLGRRMVSKTVLPVLLLTSFSLYVSSLSSSGVRAMICALPVATGAALYGFAAYVFLMTAASRAVPFTFTGRMPLERIAAFRSLQSLMDTALLGGVLMVAATVLWLGFRNYRRVDRSPRDLAVQAFIILGALTLMAGVPSLIWIALRPGA